MNESLVRGGETAEFLTRERVYITERLNDPAIPRVSLADTLVRQVLGGLAP